MLTRKIKKYYLNLLFSFLEKSKFKHKHADISYSQEGEDMILRRSFENKRNGFYVDIGAHHPKRFSNTFYFYRQGWRGINIDAMPRSMELFNKIRPRDINIEAAISDEKVELTYYMFNEPALNTLSKESAEITKKNKRYILVCEKKVETISLKEVLDNHFNQKKIDIDFLSVDAEGVDLKVLKSNDWNKYRPYIVLAEDRHCNMLNEIVDSDIYVYMNEIGYKFIAKTLNTLFFKKC